MPLLEWTQDLSVDLKNIDEQHKTWIGIINELHDAMRAGKGNVVLEEILGRVIDFTKTHFGTEEMLMAQVGYADLASHKKLHDELIAKVEAIREKKKEGKLGLSIEVLETLRTWIIEHVQMVDKKYSPALKAKGLG